MSFWSQIGRILEGSYSGRPSQPITSTITGKHQQFIIWKRGHTTHDLVLDSAQAVREAQRIFDDARFQGMAAIRTSPGPAEVITHYDPNAEVIEFTQPITGG